MIDSLVLYKGIDDVIPFANSEELARMSGATWVEVDADHRLAAPEPLVAMSRAYEEENG